MVNDVSLHINNDLGILLLYQSNLLELYRRGDGFEKETLLQESAQGNQLYRLLSRQRQPVYPQQVSLAANRP